MSKIFISYGNNEYYASLERIKKEAENTGYFDKIICYTDKDIPEKITKSPLYKYKRGGGYWLWKPYIILKTLEDANVNDIVIYCDAGCEIYKHQEWNRYFNGIKHYDAVFFKLGARVKNYTRRNLIDNYKSKNGKFWFQQNQILGTFSLIKKTNSTINLVNEWLNVMLQKPEYVLDVNEKDRHLEYPFFVENRHDQAVLSATIYKYLRNKECNIKLSWQNLESRKRNGQAVFAARISDKDRRSDENRYELYLVFLAKRLMIIPYRNIRNIFYSLLNNCIK